MYVRLTVTVLAVAVALSGCTARRYDDPKTPRAVRGGMNASVVVEEFADFQCPYCGLAHPIVKELLAKYGDKVSWTFYHFPLSAIHPYAMNASLAAECANDQGKFWQMYDTLYDHQTAIGRSDLYAYAKDIGLDNQKFTDCFESRAKAQRIKDDIAEGEKRGVTGTPTFFVNGQPFSYQEFGAQIEALLKPAIPLAQ